MSHRREASYQALQNRHQAIVDGIVTINERGIIDTINPAVERIFGYTGEELVGQNIKILMPSPYRDQHDQYLKNYQQTGNKRIIGIGREVTGLRKDGSTLPLDLAVSETHIDGKTMYIGILRDISERKLAEQTLQDALRHVHEQRMKEEFVANVSHELRTPLTAIKGALDLIAGGASGSIPPQATQLIDIARKNSERLLGLINDILDMSKIDSEQFEFSPSRIPLRQFLETAIRDNRPYGAKYHVDFVLDDCPSTTCIHVDPDRMMQVMANLMSNAAKFSPAGSTVRIRASEDRDRIRISVIDPGCGIPQEFHSRIFRKFSQVDTGGKQGSGLGLHIAKSIVEKHQGQLSFDSEPDRGTQFHIDLPNPQDDEQDNNG